MGAREWGKAFFADEPIRETSSSAVWRGTWPSRGQVVWANGTFVNALNPRLSSVKLVRPEVTDPKLDAQDRALEMGADA
jgi:hypothetical protein